MSNIQKKIYDSIILDSQFRNEDQLKDEFTIRELKTIEMINKCQTKLKNDKVRLLDVGCGTCKISRRLKYVDIHGIEISKPLADIAIKNGVKVSLIDIEYEKYPFDDENFDIIVSGEVVEHIINTDNFFFEINRVLKKDGFFVLSFPNINQPMSWIAMILFDLPPVYSARYKSMHLRDYTLGIMKKILRLYEFEIIYVLGSYISPFRNIFSQKLGNIMPRFSDHIIVVSKKRTNANIDDRIVIKDMRDI